MKYFNLAYLCKISALFVVFVLCVSCNDNSTKQNQRQPRIEEFGEFRVEVPWNFYSRKDNLDRDNLVQSVQWQCDSRISCTFELAIYHSIPSHLINNETKKTLVDLYANYIRKNVGSTLRENEKTDTTFHFDYYDDGLFHNYYFGVVKKGNKMITYYYDGYSSFYKSEILKIVNSICLWDSIPIEYNKYENARLSYSINYPSDFKVKEIIDVNRNYITFFSCNILDSTKFSNLSYTVSKNKYYNDHLIDSLVLKDTIINESLGQLNWQMNKNKDKFLHKEREAYRYSEFSLIDKKQYLVCFVKDYEEYYIIKFGDSVDAIIFQHSNKISDIISSFTIQ